MKKGQNSFIYKLSSVIVNGRKIIYFLTVLFLIFSVFSRNWVDVVNDLSYFLPPSSDTKQALNVMEGKFVTYGSAEVLVANVTKQTAKELLEKVESAPGVSSVEFEDSDKYYKNTIARYSVSFEYQDDDVDNIRASGDKILEALAGYDVYICSDVYKDIANQINDQINTVMVFVAIIVVAVLLLTSKTYGEVPVMIITFLVAMLTNQGTNFLLGKISFVAGSVTTILQLALSLDYAVILCNRFKEEHEKLPVKEAAIAALAKAMPEIAASSLTTIGGLAALLFMQFKVGPDMGISLIKAIIFSLLSVFLLMPGLLVLFGKLIDRTKHKVFIPKVDFIGKFALSSRIIVPVLFVAVLVLSCIVAGNCPYEYGYENVTQASELLEENFGKTDFVAVVVPAGDYDKESETIENIKKIDGVDSVLGIASVEIKEGCTLTDKISSTEFAKISGTSNMLSQLLYTAYAVENGDAEKAVGNTAEYRVRLLDIFTYLCNTTERFSQMLDPAMLEELAGLKGQIDAAKAQLESPDYDRFLVNFSGLMTEKDANLLIDRVKAQTGYVYDEYYIGGNSVMRYDFRKSFTKDNIIVNVFSILIVLLVLLFTFKSVGMPILLILVIQGSIWINFSLNTIANDGLFFMCFLVVSSIQMGANIDYAIVIGSRFNELKNKMKIREAIIETMNISFPTVITSGTILVTAGYLIGYLTTEPAVSGIGAKVGSGTVITLLLVLFVLPQILLIGSKFVDKTTFKINTGKHKKRLKMLASLAIDNEEKTTADDAAKEEIK